MFMKTSYAILLLCAGLGTAAIARAGQMAEDDKQINDITVRLRLNRIEPAALTVPAGRYTIHIINGIVPGAPIDYDLRKASDKGSMGGTSVLAPGVLQGLTQVAAKTAPKGTAQERMAVKLTPGTYILWTPGRAEWQCQITVTPKP